MMKILSRLLVMLIGNLEERRRGLENRRRVAVVRRNEKLEEDPWLYKSIKPEHLKRIDKNGDEEW